MARAGVLVATGIMRQEALQYDAALKLLLEARELYRTEKSVRGEAWALTWLGRDAFYRAPASSETRALFEESLSRYRESDFPAGAGWALAFLANIALIAEDDDLARQRAQEALQLGRSAHIGQVEGQALRMLATLDSRAGDYENSDRRLDELIAIHKAAGNRAYLLTAHVEAAELAASRGDVARATLHLASGAELARDAAVLVGARLGLSRLTFPKRFRPIVEALEVQGLRDEITAGANLSAD